MFNKEFYPTPQSLINKMLDGIDFNTIKTVLEPSAGKGDIIEALQNKFKYYSYNRDKNTYDIDCIEIDNNLRYILTGKGFRVIHDDFLTLNTYKKYDLIVMNPPFNEGDKHLLKAIQMQENGGKIVCILNAETLKNPCTNTRKDLNSKLLEYNAEIEYIKNAFYGAERVTDVEIVLIKINIPKTNKDSIILDHLKKEEQQHFNKSEKTYDSLINSDFVEGIIQQYNFEVKAGISLINEYENLQPLILKSFKNDYGNSSILKLEINQHKEDNTDSLTNAYIKKVRSKYWNALFISNEFNQLLTSDLQQQYCNKINELQNYDFSFYNIKQIQIDINKSMIKSVEDTILALFEEFSHKYSWYDKTSKNIHYYNGWKTNKAWIINKKIIIPLAGYRDMEYSWGKYEPTNYKIVRKLMDIEKVFNYLDGGLTEDIDIEQQLKTAEYYQETKDIQLKYFNVTFYKKGTCHIVFKDEKLLAKFNIFGSQRKGWLPPTYGKVKYEDMTKEEQTVINEFEGKESYSKVVKDTNYYIYNPSKILMVTDQAV